MNTTIDFTCYMQVTHGDILNNGEYGCITITATLDVYIQCMAVAVERTAIGPIEHSHGFINIDVGFQAGVDKILAFGSLHHITELVPVLGRTDGNKFGFSRGFLYP